MNTSIAPNSDRSAVVTVMIPVYNGADYVAEAIESVLSQEGIVFDILIGDNASTDDTLAVLARYTDPRIKVLTSDKNLGIFGNLTRLFNEVKAPLVKILCADDYLLPGGLAKQVSYMQAKPYLAFSRCWGEGDSTNTGKRKYNMFIEQSLPEVLYPPAGFLAFAAFGCLTGNLSRAIIRPGILGNQLRFDLSMPYTGDYEFWARLAQFFPFALQNEELVHVRCHAMQSSVVLNKQNELSVQIDELLFRFFKKMNVRDLILFQSHWSIVFLSQRWHEGLKHLFRGNLQASLISFKPKPYVFNNFITFIIYLLSLNGRFGRRFTSSRILRIIRERNGHLEK